MFCYLKADWCSYHLNVTQKIDTVYNVFYIAVEINSAEYKFLSLFKLKEKQRGFYLAVEKGGKWDALIDQLDEYMATNTSIKAEDVVGAIAFNVVFLRP